ncbi:hypothetical protein QQS21_010595 [Conoideocrella luteorostrata]|uniref:Uncharacterized protein n=1 Tax=Conoideocrella luteorostrata TaxID=1105319 RepID=A0AAJ0CEP5_9HYPO|nr:hypothetical protein QQS21_010595 [Conoideocrella luteorostrata]
MPHVLPVRLGNNSTDLSADYGTPNLFFLYYVSPIPEGLKDYLYSLRDAFQAWNAWELGQAESQTRGHVVAGRLPSDSSIASRVHRNNYRSKAVAYFREASENWLSVAHRITGQKSVVTREDEVGLVVVRELRALANEYQLQPQFSVFLAISNSLDLQTDNKLFFTQVHYKYDKDRKQLQPLVQDITYQIKKSGNKDKLEVVIDLTIITYNFDIEFWRKHGHDGGDAIREGEPIRKQMAMDFFVDDGKSRL